FALTVLVAIGVCWCSLSWRHPPRFMLALWFWVGIAGMVVTVETPNLHRMALAVPVLPLLAALVLDTSATRLWRWARTVAPEWDAALVIGGAALLIAIGIAVQQGRYYFQTYANMFLWPGPTVEANAFAAEGRRGLAMSLGRESWRANV